LGTLLKRLPRELRLPRIKTAAGANRFLRERFVPDYNARFAVPAAEPGSAFVPYVGQPIADILSRRKTWSPVPTIAFPTTGAACRFRRSAIAGTMCGPSCGCMNIRMAGLPSSMVRVVWRGSSQKEAIAMPKQAA